MKTNTETNTNTAENVSVYATLVRSLDIHTEGLLTPRTAMPWPLIEDEPPDFPYEIVV